MIYCKKCNTENADTARMCVNCGNSLNKEIEVDTKNKPKTPVFKRKWFQILVTTFVITVVIFLLLTPSMIQRTRTDMLCSMGKYSEAREISGADEGKINAEQRYASIVADYLCQFNNPEQYKVISIYSDFSSLAMEEYVYIVFRDKTNFSSYTVRYVYCGDEQWSLDKEGEGAYRPSSKYAEKVSGSIVKRINHLIKSGLMWESAEIYDV